MKILFCIIMICIIDSNPAYAVHDEIGKVRCLDCHPRLPFNGAKALLNERAGEVCTGCHASGGRMSETISHPVNIVPSMAIPRDLPTDAQGRMTCITCHTFHRGHQDAGGNKRYFLRRQRGKAFCYTCHKKLS
jgi:predicted CXXCH cytochrome family protein